MKGRGNRWQALAAIVLATLASPVNAGPPYETDDPDPTAVGKYEVYAFASLDDPLSQGSGAGGIDLNYGSVRDVQLTATLPVSYARDPARHRW